MRRNAYLLILISILLLGAILRFANTPDRYSFDGDAVRDAIVAYEGAKHFSFPLAGPFSSTGPYTFGPWYFIGIILFSIISPTPFAPWILMSILSLLTIFVMGDIGRMLYSKTFGIILAVITAIAPVQIDTAIGLSNISPVPFFAALSVWVTLRLLTKEATHYLWYLLLGLALGIGINMHFQMLGLLALPLLLWFRMGWKKYYIPLLIFLGLFISFIPLLIFNYFTNWHTVRGINEMLIAKERTYVPNSWKIYLFQFWSSHLKYLFALPIGISVTLVVGFLTTFFRDVKRKKYSIGLTLLAITFFINFLWLRFYWGERHDVYLYYLSPLLFIFLGYTIFSLLQMRYGKILFVCFSLVLGWYMLVNDYTKIVNVPENIARQEAQLLHNKYPDNNLVLYSCNPYYEPHKRAIVYLLRFHQEPQAQERKIAMKGNDCMYPAGQKEQAYTRLLPELKEANFNFIDISQATPEAIKNASWQVISTNEVFNSTINWWQK